MVEPNMVKDALHVTIERKVLKRIEDYQKIRYPGLSKSAVVEILLREALPPPSDLSVMVENKRTS